MLDIYLCQDPNMAAMLLSKKINSILNLMAPVKKIQLRRNYAPWITPECKVGMDARDYAQKKASETQTDEDWSEYKIIRNRVTKQVRQAKSIWQRNKLKTCEGDPGKVWNKVL